VKSEKARSLTGILLSTAYFPPVEYFAIIRKFPVVLIEKYENYSKQSYRNRCNILAANGLLPLVIPVKRIRGDKTVISEIKPDYTYNWQKLHRLSIESAYRSAPYYEYYIDEIIPFLEARHKYLLDLNSAILDRLMGILEITANRGFTDSYLKDPPPGFLDRRESIHPKTNKSKTGTITDSPRYNQVFGDRFDFVPGLSILDLLFNTGPDAGSVMELQIPGL
jgi:hypothetical protein